MVNPGPRDGQNLRIRAMVYVAGEPVPFFWPMRSFIHHNPLHGLEHLPFEAAMERGTALFHARGFLPRAVYQGYLADGKIDPEALAAQVRAFASDRATIPGIDLDQWLLTLMQRCPDPVAQTEALTRAADVHAALTATGSAVDVNDDPASALAYLHQRLLGERPVYEAVDALHGTEIGDALDDLVIRACLDFFDEGQSVWVMPDRELGLFKAWSRVAGRDAQALLGKIASAMGMARDTLMPEMVIDHIMRALEVPEANWIGYFTREIARLHGWSGFIRWRASAARYHWADRYPGDLVDLLAIRLTLAWVLTDKRTRGRLPKTRGDLDRLVAARSRETFLRMELVSGRVLAETAHRVEACLARGNADDIDTLFADYVAVKRAREAQEQAARLRALASEAGTPGALDGLSLDHVAALTKTLSDFERVEGMIWLRALEARAMDQLLGGLSLEPPPPREKRPFVQAAFCIDTRSERIRRHLEAVGDYQTFGIAGFFGVPVSLIELGKGSEMHLCPVLLTPKNLVLEMSAAGRADEHALSALERAMHTLKESVLSPFVTVEAIGLLFGFDMIGKTVAPQVYGRWRSHLHAHKPSTHLLVDKLTREQADSILRTVQRAIIVEAAGHELALAPEDITDDRVRELREAALGNAELEPDLGSALGVTEQRVQAFVQALRTTYRINTPFASRQLEQLGRIGFSLDEQVGFVHQALRSIGLTGDFSRFVLLVGHGSTSENNPYESALDCGACGGNHGLVSARVLARMANRPAVRRRLAERGIAIPDDAWFIPALHNTTTDEISLHDLELLPTSHLVYLDRLRNGLTAAARRCAQERLPTLEVVPARRDPAAAARRAQRNAVDWSQVRPEWGLSRNAYFVIGRRTLTQAKGLDGRAFLHSYDYHTDPHRRLLETILTGPLVVAQWINMEHYFSAVDNERFGSGSKVYHNVAGRFGVMTGNLSDLRTGLPSQTVLTDGRPYHEPMRLITVIEAPFTQAQAAVENVVAVKRLVRNGWIRLLVIDPETGNVHLFEDGDWRRQAHAGGGPTQPLEETRVP
jgi:uncharacterized protein YbcC (UPF0753/DUF2309 family)